jgi:4'-phosphopantetheinyl transferase
MVEVYAVPLTERLNDDLFLRLLTCVDEKKQQRIRRFRHWQDAHRTLYGDLLVRYIIMRTLEVDNSDIRFSVNAYNKPRFDHPSSFHFNVAHSGKWIVCAIADRPVGVDVEQINDVNLDISMRFFSEDEHSIIMQREEPDRRFLFYALWTLKESYLKAMGKGLYQPLDSFTIRFIDRDNIGLFSNGEMIPDVYFKQYSIEKDYSIAVCAHSHRFDDFIVAMDIRDIVESFI